MTLPAPTFVDPLEDYAPRDPPSSCSPTAKPGVVMFCEFVRKHFGTGVGLTPPECKHEISRECDRGASSHHHEGRAWDWMVSAQEPEDVARVEALLGWLLAPDVQGRPDAIARRAGIDYIIWDRRIWTARQPRWVPYDGYDADGRCTATGGCRSAHRDHVHLSFSRDGAAGLTSFYSWLSGGQGEDPPYTLPAPAEPGAKPSLSGGHLVAAAAGAAVGYLLVSVAQRISMGVGSSAAARRV